MKLYDLTVPLLYHFYCTTCYHCGVESPHDRGWLEKKVPEQCETYCCLFWLLHKELHKVLLVGSTQRMNELG